MRTTAAANVRRLRVLVGIAVVSAALLSVTPATPAVSSEVFPVADSYASALHENDGHGDLPYLRADDQPRRTMYLKFDVHGVRGGSTVALKLWIEKRTRTGLQVRGSGNDWDESSLTFENAPTPGPVAAESGPLPRESWISIDVTSLVSRDGEVSLALTTTNENSINVPSREADPSLRPRLVVTSPDPEPEPVPLSPFTVTAAGTLYQASSAAGVTYTGTLKTVVESAAGDLGRAGGGVVRFSPGAFDLGRDALEFQGLANVQFEGAGVDATEIRNSSIASLDTEVFDLARTSGIQIRGMTLAATGSPRTTSDAIDVDGGSDTLIENVRITASRGRGIVFDGKDLFAGTPLQASRNVVRDCAISDVPGDGIQLLAASESRIERCAITNAGRHGISIVKASAVAGQANKKSLANLLAANVIRGSANDGINITGSDGNQLLGNIVVNSSSTVTGGDGIRLSATDGIGCDGNLIQANAANDTRPVRRQRYGLNISDPLCARTDVRENDFSSNLRGPIQDLGTDTIFSFSVDLEAPTAPIALAVAAGATRVDVTWSQATDNVGVAGYTIYRDGVPIGNVAAGTHAFSDATVAGSTTYSYSVDAFDAVGNHSDPSAAVSVTTPPGVTISTFDAVADAYVNADAPTTNFGGGDELRTDNTPLIRSLLRFDISGLTGTVSRAKLRIFANSSSSAGFEVRLLAGTFDETGVTHDTAPAIGTLLATSPAFTAGGYIEVDITSAISGDGIVELALIALGDTATSFGSRESANRAQLVIETSG